MRQGFEFFPVERRQRDGVCTKVRSRLEDLAALEQILMSLAPERLQVRCLEMIFHVCQVVELVCAREMPRPADVPRGPKAFPICGVPLPLMGTTYQLLGRGKDSS